MPARRLLSGAVLLAFVNLPGTMGCGGGDSTGSPAPVATVTVTPNPVSVDPGSTVQLTAILADAEGNELTGRSITWTSSATGTATVDGSGLVTGVATGAASIAATSEGKTGSTALTVGAGPANTPRVMTSSGGKVPLNTLFEFLFVPEAWIEEELDVPVLSGGEAAAFGGPGTAPGLAAALATPGRVLFAGGFGGGPIVAGRQAVLYEPASDQATSLEMVAARYGHTMTRLPGERALVAGGDSGTIGGAIVTLNSAEIFDLTTTQFTATGSMAEARRSHAAAPLPDGRVLVTGGLVPASGGPGSDLSATTEIFDPTTGTFSPGPDMTEARAGHSATALDDGRVLVVGGSGGTSAETYDPTGNVFTPVEDMEVAHGQGHRAVKLLDGTVLILGGDAGVIQPTAAAEVFDPATDQFSRIADMTTTRMLHFAVLQEDDGRVLIGGGQDASGDVLASSEVYDPVTGEFTPAGDMPLPGSEQAAVFVRP